MNIAIYKDQRYEFKKGDNAEDIILLSNVWQQDFEIENIEGMELYTKHITMDESDALWETKITLSLTEEGEQYPISVLDTPTGDMITFLGDRIPEELQEHTVNNSIFYRELKATFPDAFLWKVKRDYYDGSRCAVPTTIMDAIGTCVKLAKLSARETILECGNCGFHFPYTNANTPYGTIYNTECPVCGSQIVKKRS